MHPNQSESSSKILQFYLNIAPDPSGRMLSFIWQQDYVWLEKTHDYIQWLFPLQDRSRFNPNAPILTEVDIHHFKTSPEIKQNLQRSLDLMLVFYGLKRQPSAVVIAVDLNSFADRKKQWLHWGNHNHMRITRILKSLSLLGMEAYAKAFFDCLQQIYIMESGSITRLTFSYWQEASQIIPR